MIEFDTSYLSWGSSTKLASSSLLLVGIKPLSMVVGPPLHLLLQLSLLHSMDFVARVPLPCLVGVDVFVKRVLDVVGLDAELT